MTHRPIPEPPIQLKALQEWFANIISCPLKDNEFIRPYTSNGANIDEAAAQYINPSHTLLPYERLQIYNQQYWWRLLKILQSNFPLVLRLFGVADFNEKIALPYLLRYPPSHWSLNVLGKYLSSWIAENYQGSNQALVLDASRLDWAFMDAFIAPQYITPKFSQIDEEQSETLLSCNFYLQPHLHLFSWNYNLFEFRRELLQQNANYWITHGIPDLLKAQSVYFLLYRNFQNDLAWREITEEEFLLLERFKLGTNILNICQYIEEQKPLTYEIMVGHFQNWLQNWIQWGWLALAK